MYPKWMDSRPVHHQTGVGSREFREAEAIHTRHLRWMVFPIIIVTGILPNNVFIFFKPPHISKILSSSTCKTWLGPGRACWCSSRAWHAIVSQIHFHTCLKQPARFKVAASPMFNPMEGQEQVPLPETFQTIGVTSKAVQASPTACTNAAWHAHFVRGWSFPLEKPR